LYDVKSASQNPQEKAPAACHRFWERKHSGAGDGCARKYVTMLNAGTRTPITSLQYFADIIEEVKESAIPESY
jgi:hypothetical protein